MDNNHGEKQAGLRKGYSTIDHTLRESVNKKYQRI